jgi:hypothetical protein
MFPVVAVLTAFGATLSAAPAAPPRKQIVNQEVFAVVPGTLEELFTTADEVLDVKIVSSVVKAVGDTKNPFVRTFYTARVLNARKGLAGRQVVFTQAAGELELGDHIIRSEGVPLTVGSRYVVFLRRNENFGGRMLVGERSGAFKLDAGRVQPQGFGKLAEEQRNLRETSFTDELNRLARRTPQD